jgi:glycosyltransferase involved in cell wall biosynthesis
MNPFFSVIIPTYNRALLIKKAIQSVLQQTYTDWELIIVDDGSTDNTKEVIESYSDKRIRYIYQQNAERSEARNNGIKNALGKYICFLDSDDFFLPNRLELLLLCLEKEKFPIAAFYTGAGIEVNEVVTFNKEKVISTDIFTHILNSAIHSQQMCIHTNILQQFKYDKRFRIGEDMELWLRIADKFPFIFLQNQQTIIVVDQEGRSVNVKRNNVYAEYLQTLQYIFSSNHTGTKISRKIQKKLLGNCYFGIAKYHIYQKNRMAGINLLVKSIFTDINTPLLRFRINVLTKLLLFSSMTKIRILIE